MTDSRKKSVHSLTKHKLQSQINFDLNANTVILQYVCGVGQVKNL